MNVFDPQSFANPSGEFRPLQIIHGMDAYLLDPEHLMGEEGIDRRLELLKRMGLGGIVTNIGFKDYLMSERQWEIYRYGLRKADDLGLVMWLYDEKGYPSGTAGGIVTRAHPEYTALGLACYRVEIDGPAEVSYHLPMSCRRFVWAGATPDAANASRESMWDLTALAGAHGNLTWQAPAGHWTLFYLAERVMYEGTHAAGNVCDFKQYVNLLNPDAVAEFLRVTHDQYARETPPDLWGKIRAIFTDEPSLMTAYVPELPERFHGKIPVVDTPLFKDRPAAVPWVEDFLARFQALKGYDLRPLLFELFASESEEACYTRQDYYDVVTRLYTAAFYTQVLQWCQAHGIASSGHVLAEEGILPHVAYHGSLFAPIRQMDLPGIDMLNSDPQDMLNGDSFTAVKQVTSAAHLAGAKRLHSESSDWVQGNAGRHASLAERCGQGNLQYVLGINQITAYWGWGEIGEDEYTRYNDYMGRLASLLTGGAHACDVALFYPIRTAWAHFVPSDKPIRWTRPLTEHPDWLERVDNSYPELMRGLLRQQVDYDVIDEEAIVTGQVRDGALCVADERYRAIILPPLHAIGSEAAQALAAFARAGGLLVSTGPLPELAESASKSGALRETFGALFGDGGPARMVAADELAPFLRATLTPDLMLAEPNRDILYTHRQLDGRELYFIVNNAATPATIRPALRVAGPYQVYRPLTGAIEPAAAPLCLELEGYEGVFVVATSK
jgi:hypothetical protein